MPLRPARPQRDRGRHLVAVPALLVGTVVAVLAPAPAALAHDDLVRSAPGAGEVVAQAPSTIELEFAGAPVSASVQLLDGCGRLVGSTTTMDGPVVRAEVVEEQVTDAGGSWTVSWTTIGGDGHDVEGELSFSVDGTPDCSTGSVGDALGTPAVDPSAVTVTADAGPVGTASTEPTASEETGTGATGAGATVPTAPLLAGGIVLLAGVGSVVGSRLRHRQGAGA